MTLKMLRWFAMRSFSSKSQMTPTQYCLDQIKKHDYENFLCLLFLPPPARESAIAVRAFNVEIAQVSASTSERQLAEMRYSFWEDTLDSVYKNEPPQHPVALELCRVVCKYQLSKVWLSRLIDSRRRHSPPSSFATTQSVEQYAENTVSSIYYLSLQAQGVSSTDVDHAASHLGKCYGVCTLLRSVVYSVNRGEVLLPLELLARHRLSQHSLLQATAERHQLRECGYDMASIAHQHLHATLSLKEKVPDDITSVFLPLVICRWYLKMLQKVDFDLYHPSLQTRHTWLPWQLWWRSKRGLFS